MAAHPVATREFRFSTRILGRHTALFRHSLFPNRVLHGFVGYKTRAAGADPDAQNEPDKQTALHLALIEDHGPTAALLLQVRAAARVFVASFRS